MADKKISALTASTTPLAGTEVLPIVQGGVTVKVAVSNLTAGRAVSALSYAATNNVQGSSLSAIGDAGVNLGRANLQNTAAGGKNWVLGDGVGTSNGTFAVYNLTDFVPTLRVTSTGDVSVPVGNLVIGTSGKGIDFSADPSAAGMTSELLDDYEEGTWTPALTFGGAAVGMTGTFTGSYNKVGNKVYVVGKIVLTAKGSSTGAALISGLPFTSAASTQSSNVIDPVASMSGLTIGGCIFGVVSGALFYPMVQGTTNRAQITDTNFTNTSNFQFSAVYLV